MKKNKTAKSEPVVRSSGNVFSDLEVDQPEEAMTKARLASVISDLIEQRKMTQKQAAEVLGIDQPKVSMLLRGRLRDFSVDRLLRFLVLLQQNVRIVISSSGKRSAERVVQVA